MILSVVTVFSFQCKLYNFYYKLEQYIKYKVMIHYLEKFFQKLLMLRRGLRDGWHGLQLRTDQLKVMLLFCSQPRHLLFHHCSWSWAHSRLELELCRKWLWRLRGTGGRRYVWLQGGRLRQGLRKELEAGAALVFAEAAAAAEVEELTEVVVENLRSDCVW